MGRMMGRCWGSAALTPEGFPWQGGCVLHFTYKDYFQLAFKTCSYGRPNNWAPGRHHSASLKYISTLQPSIVEQATRCTLVHPTTGLKVVSLRIFSRLATLAEYQSARHGNDELLLHAGRPSLSSAI